MASPSHARRQALRQADAGNNGIRISNGLPLERYYDISKRLLSRFQQAFDKRQLDEAYIYGVRFATLCVDDIPKHAKYEHPHLSRQRKETAKKCDQVLQLLDIVRQRMDAEEILRQQQQREEEECKKIIQKQEEQRDAHEREKILEKEKQEQQQVELKMSALAKLSAMQSQIIATPKVQKQQKQEPMREPEKQQQPTQTKVVPSYRSDQEAKKDQVTTTTTTKIKKEIGEEAQAKDQDEEGGNLDIDTETTILETATNIMISSPPKRSPRRQEEEQTISSLQEAIKSQESRLEEIEQVLIPSLLQKAKSKLTELHHTKKRSHRKAALHCVARKRQLERQSETIKAAIFHMETQMFLLENAMEDRQVTKAVDEANQAMKGLEQSVGITDLANFSNMMMEPQHYETPDNIEDITDHELLEELEEWFDTSSSPAKEAKDDSSVMLDYHKNDDDDVSILSLPQVPFQTTPTKSLHSQTSTNKSTSSELLKAVVL